MARVFVAMSGGVDSSVAAALLLEQGHAVTGVTMQLWPSGDEEGGCCSVSAVRDARRVCDLLGIAHYTLNFRESFDAAVVQPFADSYAAGETPNPCIVCNDVVKFADLLARVKAQGADFLATGHYARITREGGVPRLLRGTDPQKDQSYFLYRMKPSHLENVLFPVGELHKPEVRAFAERFGLPVAKKAESQEVCFAAAGEHGALVRERRPDAGVPGDIVTLDGSVVGGHSGIADYTVGQRKGLRIGGSAEPLYVVAIDAERNRVVVGPREALAVREVVARDVSWTMDVPTSGAVAASVRYRMEPVPASLQIEGERLRVSFESPIEGVAPGQAVVCYEGDLVLGGGVIECAS